MPNVQLIESPSPEEDAVIQIVEQRIVGAFDDLCAGLEGPVQLAMIDINDFQGLQLSEARLLAVSGIGTHQSRTQLVERNRFSMRDFWHRGPIDVKGSNLLGERYYQEDADLIQAVTESWKAAAVNIVDQHYRMWSLILTATASARKKLDGVGLPWILENGEDDFAPLTCAKVLNPNGEAADYLKEVWGVEG